MELLIQFNAQWHGIRDVVLSEAKRQLAAGLDLLTVVYFQVECQVCAHNSIQFFG